MNRLMKTEVENMKKHKKQIKVSSTAVLDSRKKSKKITHEVPKQWRGLQKI